MEQFDVSKITVSFDSPKFFSSLPKIFREYGVAVITDVLAESRCDEYVSEIVTAFENYNSHLDRNNIQNWKTEYLPKQAQFGMYHSMSSIPTLNKVRTEPKIEAIFQRLYSNLRGKEVNSLVVSNDGFTLIPNGARVPQYLKKDWAHVDQTDSDEVFACVQGQAVLTDTTAAFVASIKSHKLFPKIKHLLNITGDNYFQFSAKEVQIIKPLVESHFNGEIGSQSSQFDGQIGSQSSQFDGQIGSSRGYWQVPVLAKKGSFIVWSSSTIHSSRFSQKIETPCFDFWKGWRCVIYICYRPSDELTREEHQTLQYAREANLATNHWSNRIFF